MPSPHLLPSIAPTSRLSYVGSQILGDLGPSETTLSDRAIKRIHSSFPVPREQEILWANVAFGTRPHGLVLTNAGIFLKDGPGDEEDGDTDDLPDTGYHYLRWANFDTALISHQDGHPTIGGQRVRDRERFFDLAATCVRITNRRIRMQKAGRKAVKGVVDPGAPIATLWYPSVKETFSHCFDSEGFYGPVDANDVPRRIEVPADQYDALIQRMRKKVAAGWAPPLEDGNAAGALLRRSAFTYAQGHALACTGRIPLTMAHPRSGAVICKDPRGLTAILNAWLSERERLGSKAPSEAQGSPGAAAEALASGAVASKEASKVAQAQMANFIVDNAASTAGRTVGAAGARVLTAAMGITFAPLALAASFALGDMCGKAGTEAVAMAKDLLFEPDAQIYGRLLDGVLANVVFEYALTTAEQGALATAMTAVNPEVFQRLGSALREAPEQESLIRALVVPLCEAVRRM